VERNFEIIGEAIKRLAQHDPTSASRIGAHAQIIAFRNVLIYGYDLVDHTLVWNAIEQQLPVLQRDVESLAGAIARGPVAGRIALWAVASLASHRDRQQKTAARPLSYSETEKGAGVLKLENPTLPVRPHPASRPGVA